MIITKLLEFLKDPDEEIQREARILENELLDKRMTLIFNDIVEKYVKRAGTWGN